jgi:hypothetical protein
MKVGMASGSVVDTGVRGGPVDADPSDAEDPEGEGGACSWVVGIVVYTRVNACEW